jgi:anti-sigma-K factor RskA
MKYRGKPELQERLAAEYVLGTLRGRARQRFQAWMREDAALRRAVAEWEERLAPLAAAVAPVRPPRRVWQGIEARLHEGRTHAPRPAVGGPAPQPGFWDSLAFWRNWGLVASGCAAALIALTVFWRPGAIEDEVQRRVDAEIGRRLDVALDNAVKKMQPSYVATVEDKQGNVVFVAYAARKSDELWVKSVALEPLKPGTRYELWGLSAKEGGRPKSLGMIPTVEKGTIKLAAVADQALSDFPKLAISLEPDGGSKTGQPTGPVMYVGDCHKFW